MYYRNSTRPDGDMIRQPEFLSEMPNCLSDTYNFQPTAANSMDAVAKAVWVGALRSGEFKQGKNKLQDPYTDTNCCLGVKATIDGLEFKKIVNGPDFNPVGYFNFPSATGQLMQQSNNWLPIDYANAQGMIDGNGTFYYKMHFFGIDFWQRESLGNLNDQGFTFSQIADIIECFF